MEENDIVHLNNSFRPPLTSNASLYNIQVIAQLCPGDKLSKQVELDFKPADMPDEEEIDIRLQRDPSGPLQPISRWWRRATWNDELCWIVSQSFFRFFFLFILPSFYNSSSHTDVSESSSSSSIVDDIRSLLKRFNDATGNNFNLKSLPPPSRSSVASSPPYLPSQEVGRRDQELVDIDLSEEKTTTTATSVASILSSSPTSSTSTSSTSMTTTMSQQGDIVTSEFIEFEKISFPSKIQLFFNALSGLRTLFITYSSRGNERAARDILNILRSFGANFIDNDDPNSLSSEDQFLLMIDKLNNSNSSRLKCIEKFLKEPSNVLPSVMYVGLATCPFLLFGFSLPTALILLRLHPDLYVMGLKSAYNTAILSLKTAINMTGDTAGLVISSSMSDQVREITERLDVYLFPHPFSSDLLPHFGPPRGAGAHATDYSYLAVEFEAVKDLFISDKLSPYGPVDDHVKDDETSDLQFETEDLTSDDPLIILGIPTHVKGGELLRHKKQLEARFRQLRQIYNAEKASWQIIHKAIQKIRMQMDTVIFFARSSDIKQSAEICQTSNSLVDDLISSAPDDLSFYSSTALSKVLRTLMRMMDEKNIRNEFAEILAEKLTLDYNRRVQINSAALNEEIRDALDDFRIFIQLKSSYEKLMLIPFPVNEVGKKLENHLDVLRLRLQGVINDNQLLKEILGDGDQYSLSTPSSIVIDQLYEVGCLYLNRLLSSHLSLIEHYYHQGLGAQVNKQIALIQSDFIPKINKFALLMKGKPITKKQKSDGPFSHIVKKIQFFQSAI